MRRIDLIIIHCSATRSDRRFTFEDLDRCHRARGWKGCGYHYYITRDGRLHFGRSEAVVGAHALHHNQHSIGICYEGGLAPSGSPADTRTAAQKQTLTALLVGLKADYPKARIIGHNELPNVSKACPCFLASEEYGNL